MRDYHQGKRPSKLFVGVTDQRWFEFLKSQHPEEVNFWRPGGLARFRAISPGSPFLFKLHSPNNYIAGGGFLLRHSLLPLSLAWEAFGMKNGAASHSEFLQMVNKRRGNKDSDPLIGCTILIEPFFLDREDWIAAPADWSGNIVQGKGYNLNSLEGARLWAQVREKLAMITPRIESAAEWDGYGIVHNQRARLGQGSFRVLVTEAYDRRCAVTGERTLPVLEAAHIKPYSSMGPHAVENGLLLRSDLHILFDKGYVTVTKDYEIEVSRSIKDRFKNGKDYYKLHGQPRAVLPQSTYERPARAFLEWHNENVFLVG